MSIDSQITLLRLAARVDPILRQAVVDVTAEYDRLRTAAEAARDAIDEFEFLYRKADGDITEQIETVFASLPALDAALGVHQ